MSDKKKNEKSFLEGIQERFETFLSSIKDDKKKVDLKSEKFAKATLADGETIVATEGETFEVGQELYVATAEGDPILATAGEYTLEDGSVLIVGEDGAITEIRPVESSEEELSDDEKPITRKEFKEFQDTLLNTLQTMSAQKPEEKKGKKEEVNPELEALKTKMADMQRKNLSNQKKGKKEPSELLPENFGKRQRRHVNASRQRAEESMAAFFAEMEEA